METFLGGGRLAWVRAPTTNPVPSSLTWGRCHRAAVLGDGVVCMSQSERMQTLTRD